MKGRRFAAVLIVLSMILMLVPVQAFADEETDGAASESVVAVSEIPEENTLAEKEETVQEAEKASAADETSVPEAAEEMKAEEVEAAAAEKPAAI